MLMSEARIDGHDQHLIEVRKDFFEHAGGGCRVNDDTGPFAQRLDA